MPGNAEAGACEFDEQRVEADQHQGDGDLWVGEHGQQVDAPVGPARLEAGAGGLQHMFAGGQGNRPPVNLFEQFGNVGGDDVNDAGAQRRFGRQAGGVAHRFFGEIDVAPAQFGEAAEIGDGVVGRLAGEGVGAERWRR